MNADNEKNSSAYATEQESGRFELLQGVFAQAPVAICLLKGPMNELVMINSRMTRVLNSSVATLLNKPLSDFLPDGIAKHLLELTTRVHETGKRQISNEVVLVIEIAGVKKETCIKFTLEPLLNTEKKNAGVIMIAEEVSGPIEAGKTAERRVERLENLLMQAPAAIATVSAGQLVFTSANLNFRALAGDRDLIGHPAREVLPELDEQGLWDKFDNVIRTGEPFIGNAQKLIFKKEKEDHPQPRYFNFVIQPVHRDDGTVDRTLFHATEITQQVIARKELESLESRQKLAIDAANIGTFEWIIKSSKFIYSERLAHIFGFREWRDLTQKDLSDRIHPEDKLLRARAHEHAFSKGTLLYEVRLIWPDSNVHWVKVNGKVVYDDEGNPEKMYGTALDITDHKNLSNELERLVEERTASLRKANEEIKKSEERYHKMVEEVQDYAILLIDTEGNVLNWNRGAERIKGYTEQEIVGKNFRRFYSEEDRKTKLPDSLLEIAKQKGRATQEGWRIRKDGTRFWANVVITALHDDSGETIGFSKVTRDLTERKHAEDKLRQYAIDLENQNKELEQFAYVASHDLQEPLRKIRTFSDLVKHNLDNKELANRYFEKIENSAQRMTELIRSILNYSRLSAKKEKMQEVSLNDILRDVSADLELLIHEKHARLTADDLPVIKGIPLQLHQLFLNLIGNSLKFSKEQPEIMITSREFVYNGNPKNEKLVEGHRYAEIRFSDNGIGFEQKYADQVFTIFQRLHTKDTYAGTGIGLALCRRVVDNHHGSISVKSKPGEGTQFIVILPVEESME
jgi:PAS domain S-box-containing protein